MKLQGIEVHDILSTDLTQKGGPFHKYNANATLRGQSSAASHPLPDSGRDLAVEFQSGGCEEIVSCMELAKTLRVPYVRIRTKSNQEEDLADIVSNVGMLLRKADELDVTLIETVGLFSDTARLRDVLNRFASDHLAALWDVHHPYFDHKEDPSQSVENLGAYVRHVHIKDSVAGKDGREYTLLGEGDLPIGQLMTALSPSTTTASSAWSGTPHWMADLQDMEVIFLPLSPIWQGSTPRRESSRSSMTTAPHRQGCLEKKGSLSGHDLLPGSRPDGGGVSRSITRFKYITLTHTRTYPNSGTMWTRSAGAFLAMGYGRAATWRSGPQTFPSGTSPSGRWQKLAAFLSP